MDGVTGIRIRRRTLLRLAATTSAAGALASLAACSPTRSQSSGATPGATASQSGGIPANADPEVAAIYSSIVQKEMPGLPFAVLEGAKREGKVVWYHLTTPAAIGPTVAEFKKRFPFIQVEEFEGTGASVLERLLTEKRAGANRVDLFETSSPFLMNTAIEAGYVDAYKAAAEPMFKPGTYSSSTWYAVAVAAQICYAYNTNSVGAEQAKALAASDGLWHPSLKGLTIGLPPVSAGSSAQALYYYLEKTYGAEAWTRLKALNYKIYEVVPSGDALARGEIAVVPLPESVPLNLWTAKAPVRWTVPQPTVAIPLVQAVIKNAPNPNAGRLLQEFVLSRPAQELFATYAYPSARTDVGELRPVAKESWFTGSRSYYALDSADFQAKLPALTDQWKKVFSG